MTKPFNRDTYFKTLKAIEEIKEHQKRQRKIDELNNQIPESTWVNAKSILFASVIIGLSLFVLVGSIVLLPLVLAGILGYGIFLWVKSSIK
jgi:small-conductance mechanosensitive channel